MRAVLATVLVLSACAGSGGGGGGGGTTATHAGALTDDRPLVTAGTRCSGGTCRCRDVDPSGATVGDDADGAPPDGQKRFELRTGRGADDVQITVEGRGTLHKSGESTDTACGYVDLPPGEHRVRLRVKAAGTQPAVPRLLIYEHGEQTHSWYGTFAMSCGTGAVCSRAELEDRLAELKKPRGLFDPCGSVKIHGVRYDATHDGEDRVTGLDLEVTLKVYAFSPRFPHGGKCKGLAGE